MGIGYNCACSKCEYTFNAYLGVGFLWASVYEETVQEMKNGTFGPQGKKFFEEHPDGAITCDRVAVRCTSCGVYDDVPELKLFVPKPGSSYEPNCSCVTDDEIESHYDYYGLCEHRCATCGGTQEIIKNFYRKLESGKLPCPKCDGHLTTGIAVMWD